jgi:sulfonate dioxygenase
MLILLLRLIVSFSLSFKRITEMHTESLCIAPSYSLLRMEEHPPVGGDTAWVSQYGLYDALSSHMKKFIDGLHAVHTSRLQCTSPSPSPQHISNPKTDDTIIDSWGGQPNRPPVDSHHPAVRTHPVTGLKALNVNPGFVTEFAELKKEESDHLLQFFKFHIHSADDHYVRWKWSVGSVAMWDNVSFDAFPACFLVIGFWLLGVGLGGGDVC